MILVGSFLGCASFASSTEQKRGYHHVVAGYDFAKVKLIGFDF